MCSAVEGDSTTWFGRPYRRTHRYQCAAFDRIPGIDSHHLLPHSRHWTRPPTTHRSRQASGRSLTHIHSVGFDCLPQIQHRQNDSVPLLIRVPYVDVPFPAAVFLLPLDHIFDGHRLTIHQSQVGMANFDDRVSARFNVIR